MMLRRFLFHLLWLAAIANCSAAVAKATAEQTQLTLHTETLVLGAGCFLGCRETL